MNSAIFESAEWYAAMTLTERFSSGRNHQNPGRDSQFQRRTAERHLAEWKSDPPFVAAPVFVERLASDGMTEEDLLHILAEQVEAVQERYSTSPEWLTRLAQAYSDSGSSAPSAANVELG